MVHLPHRTLGTDCARGRYDGQEQERERAHVGTKSWYNMSMEQISATEFKANCLAVVQRVQKTGKPIEITRYGKAVAEIVPVRPKARNKSWIGSMAGTGEILGDIISPAIPESDWDMLKPARRRK